MRTMLLEGETNNVKSFFDGLINWCTTTGIQLLIKIVVALVVWWASFKLINLVFKKLEKKLSTKNVDKTITSVSLSLSRKLLKGIVIISIIGYLGIETSSIVALITSIGVTVGLALQGSLSNFAGGFIILIMRPFKLGDYVEYNGVGGTVDKISLFYTTLRTPDNKVIVVPNGTVASSTITNYSINKTRRLDLTFSIAYENDFRKAKRLINKLIEKNELILQDPKPFVNISKHNESSIDIICRVWVKSCDYWDVNYELLEEVKLEFDKNGISIPYNQIDVHIKDDSKLPNPIDDSDAMVAEQAAIDEKKIKDKIEKRHKDIEEARIKKEIEEKKTSTKIKKILDVNEV